MFTQFLYFSLLQLKQLHHNTLFILSVSQSFTVETVALLHTAYTLFLYLSPLQLKQFHYYTLFTHCFCTSAFHSENSCTIKHCLHTVSVSQPFKAQTNPTVHIIYMQFPYLSLLFVQLKQLRHYTLPTYCFCTTAF